MTIPKLPEGTWAAPKVKGNGIGSVHYWIDSMMGPELQVVFCDARKPAPRPRDQLEPPAPHMKRCRRCLVLLPLIELTPKDKP